MGAARNPLLSPLGGPALSPSPDSAPASRRPTVREASFELLRGLGLTTIFGNPGSTELSMLLDFPADFRYVLGLQESVVVGMADGFAQASRNAAVVNLHSAVGVGHAMGAIFTAYKNRTPLLITAGQQARGILPFDPFLSSARATELPQPYVKWAVEPARAADVPRAIARAYHLAMMPPRGPVLVSVPADDWGMPAEHVAPRRVSQALRPDPALLSEIAAALNAAERPAFVVGAAIDRDGAWQATLRLAEMHQARVFHSPMSGRCGFPNGHAQFAGYLPPSRERIVQKLAGHDYVLVIGAPAFTYHVDGQGPFLPQGTDLGQLIDDPAIAAWAPEGSAVLCSIGLGVEDLLALSAPRSRTPPPPRPQPARAEPPARGERMSVAYFLQTLADLRDPASVIVEEAPSARPVMHERLPIHCAETFHEMCSGGLGFGLAAAVGVALARPEQRVIALIGDGSAMYSIQALWNAAQARLPMAILILKNRRYAALQDFAPQFGFVPGARVEGSELPDLDFVALAAGQGVAGRRIEDPSQLHGALRQALQATAPMLLEIEIA
jgi:benzoylformate decarboxylase